VAGGVADVPPPPAPGVHDPVHDMEPELETEYAVAPAEEIQRVREDPTFTQTHGPYMDHVFVEGNDVKLQELLQDLL
jgi:hypothetical protein